MRSSLFRDEAARFECLPFVGWVVNKVVDCRRLEVRPIRFRSRHDGGGSPHEEDEIPALNADSAFLCQLSSESRIRQSAFDTRSHRTGHNGMQA